MEQSQLLRNVNQIYACSVERVQRFFRGTCYKKKRIFLEKIFMGNSISDWLNCKYCKERIVWSFS